MDKIRQAFQTLAGKVKEKPHLAFIAALVLLVLFAVAVSQTTKPASQPGGKQPARQSASQQAGPAQLAWKGVPVLVSGPVAPTAPKSAAALDGSVIESPLVLTATGDLKGKDSVQASVTFPLAGKYQKMSFVLAQQGLTGDMQAYAYSTHIQVVADGKTVLLDKTITKDTLLAKAQPVTLEIAGANQVTVKFDTAGKKIKKENSSYVETSDQYGPFFPVVLGGLSFE
ncbi:hypothetical protein PTH_2481 [Pelotomaculum thermopropionicum SI]|uniref:Uncharacterized protein n=1 Tax=Pelotomaculum thermopropionicum (strain DSM 13744 / JCM 10971 / SI) TaxID=370438 RepID=A5CZD1_PELTS|nr:hypothetical protein PTH_2481 [Pelotomaculum thermopropionicum SI]